MTSKRGRGGKDASHSVNAALYAASHKPTSTMAMGLKPTHVATQCWRDQVRREVALAHKWRHVNGYAAQQDAVERDAVRQTLARDAARHAAYHDATRNPELYEILYNSDNSNSGTSGGVTGGRIATTTSAAIGAHAATAAVCTSLPQAPPPPPLREQLHGPRNTQRYLHAHAAAHTLHERYDDADGPVTSSQVIGWAATAQHDNNSSSSNSGVTATTSTARRGRHAGAYRSAVDDEHAALHGYTLAAH